MVFAYISTNFFRSNDNPPHPTQQTAKALLSSFIADGDVVTDWIYFAENISNASDDGTPQWLLILQLISCICGTFSWFAVGTDGGAIQWTRILFYKFISSLVYFIKFLATLFALPFNSFRWEHTTFEVNGWMVQHLRLHNAMDFIEDRLEKPLTFTTGNLLLFGILVEDIPQLIVTFLVEDSIKSDNTDGTISSAALVNLFFSAFDIFHKLAEAWDLRKDLHNAGYIMMRSIKAHGEMVVSSLAQTASSNIILSASGERTAKLWNIAKEKCIQTFQCGSWVVQAVSIETSKVIAACDDKCLHVFDYASGAIETKIELGFNPHFILYHSHSNSIFTSGSTSAGCIQQRSINADGDNPYDTIFRYNRPASSIAFLEKDLFVSTCRQSRDVHIWRMNQEDPVQTLQLERDTFNYGFGLLSLTATLFLTVDGKDVKSWIMSNYEWIYKDTFRGHEKTVISLAKVTDKLFISTSNDGTARLWSIGKKSCVFIFRGHNDAVRSCVYLAEEQAVATGDKNGMIHLWSIAKYLESESEEIEHQQEDP